MSTVQLQPEALNPDQVHDSLSLPPPTNHGHELPREGTSDNNSNLLIQARRLLCNLIELVVKYAFQASSPNSYLMLSCMINFIDFQAMALKPLSKLSLKLATQILW